MFSEPRFRVNIAEGLCFLIFLIMIAKSDAHCRKYNSSAKNPFQRKDVLPKMSGYTLKQREAIIFAYH